MKVVPQKKGIKHFYGARERGRVREVWRERERERERKPGH